MAVRLADIYVDEDNIQKSDATPTGYNLLSGVGTENKIKGTDGADKATIDTLYHDKDQVINLGAGSDIFVFQVNDEKSDINGKKINGIVDMGEGDNDQVWFTHQLSDYEFTLRSDGGIKVTYIGVAEDLGHKGASVTFYNADKFVFRNIDDHSGENYTNVVLSHDQLYDMIAGAGNPTV